MNKDNKEPAHIWDGKPPKTYEEYMASNIVSEMWEAGFIAGKMHELSKLHKQQGGCE